MPTYSPEQTVFTLSMLSGLGSCFSGSVSTIEAALGQDLAGKLSSLQPQIGSWEVVWGPAVYELPTSDRPDNVMYVAQRTDLPGIPQLVVAIAGTNPYSFLDWIVEDFLVRTQVPWLSGGLIHAAECRISLGTFIGLSVLQTLMPGSGQPGAGTTLKSFLAGQTGAPISIAVSGHSLGGALSPTLALWLHETRSHWDPNGNATLSVLPAAGPTAGNAAFAAYSDTQIGASVTRVHNPLDIVPLAWNTGSLLTIPTLYAPLIEPDSLLTAFDDLALAISAGGGYTQINASAPALPGSAVNASLINPGHSAFENFFVQAGYQHVDAYLELMGVPEVIPLLQCAKASAETLGVGNALTRLQGKIAKFQASRSV